MDFGNSIKNNQKIKGRSMIKMNNRTGLIFSIHRTGRIPKDGGFLKTTGRDGYISKFRRTLTGGTIGD